MTINIPEYVKNVMERLEEAGYEAYIVGGCVRDALLGKTPYDYDVATSATPDEMKAALTEFRTVDTGIRHGTVTVISDGHPIETTAFRCDGEYTDHRRPDSVILTRSLSEDLARRDLTVNALAYNEKTGLVDLYGGTDDLETGIIRCVGEPAKRFDEDALRIMRALRFAATLGFEIEEETGKQIKKLAPLLSCVSAERIAVELKKLLCGKEVERVLTSYSSIICQIIPEFTDAIELDQRNPHHIYDVYTHTVKVVAATPPRAEIRLAALFHDIAKPKMMTVDEKGIGHFYGHPKESAKMTRDILKRLKFDNAVVNKVCRLVELHDIRPEATERALKRYLSKYPDVDTDELMALRRADLAAQNPAYHSQFAYLDKSEEIINRLKSNGACLTVSALNINGNDIAELGAEGIAIGKILRKLLSDVVEDKVPNEKQRLIKRAKQLYKNMK